MVRYLLAVSQSTYTPALPTQLRSALASFFGIPPDQVEVTALAGRRLLSGEVALSVAFWVYTRPEAEALALNIVTQNAAFNDAIKLLGLPPAQYTAGSMQIDADPLPLETTALPPPPPPPAPPARPAPPAPPAPPPPIIFSPFMSSAPRARARGHHALACLLVGVLLNR